MARRFSGQAFDVVEGTTFEVSGTLTGDDVSLTATGGGETLTGNGTLARLAGGEPGENPRPAFGRQLVQFGRMQT